MFRLFCLRLGSSRSASLLLFDIDPFYFPGRHTYHRLHPHSAPYVLVCRHTNHLKRLYTFFLHVVFSSIWIAFLHEQSWPCHHQSTSIPLLPPDHPSFLANHDAAQFLSSPSGSETTIVATYSTENCRSRGSAWRKRSLDEPWSLGIESVL